MEQKKPMKRVTVESIKKQQEARQLEGLIEEVHANFHEEIEKKVLTVLADLGYDVYDGMTEEELKRLHSELTRDGISVTIEPESFLERDGEHFKGKVIFHVRVNYRADNLEVNLKGGE
jgi:hypothetical protein